MSPVFDTYITPLNPFAGTISAAGSSICVRLSTPKSNPKPETKKEKIARIAKEKMYASWKTFQQNHISIIQVKQICKPRHKLTHMQRKI